MKTTLIALSLFAVAFGSPVGNRSPLIRRQQNLQTFSAALGGIEATPVVDSGNPDRPFQVKGDTFVNLGAALQRSCDQQFNACANAANGGDATLSVAECSTQKDQCGAASQGAQAGGNANANQNANQNANGNGNGNGNAVSCTKHKKRNGNKTKRTSN